MAILKKLKEQKQASQILDSSIFLLKKPGKFKGKFGIKGSNMKLVAGGSKGKKKKNSRKKPNKHGAKKISGNREDKTEESRRTTWA